MEEEMEKEKIQTEYDEINLMDYLKVIIKRKRMIFGVFLVVFIAVAVYSFFIAQKVYKTDTLLEITIESPKQLVEKIQKDVYGNYVREKLGISKGEYPKIRTGAISETNLLIIEIESPQPQKAKDILEELNNFILEGHQEKIKNKKELIKKDIERLKNKVVFLEEEKNNLEKKEKSLEWIAPYEKVNEQFTGSLFTLYDVKEKLSQKKQEIENLYIQINSLERGLEDIRLTEIIKSPTVSEGPIKPRPVLNIVIGAVLGVFLGVFFAFGKEWWEKELNTRN